MQDCCCSEENIISVAVLSLYFIDLQTQSITEFLKPADGESYYRGGRGRGGRGGRGRGGFGGNGGSNYSAPAPKIEDVGQFPSLGGK